MNTILTHQPSKLRTAPQRKYQTIHDEVLEYLLNDKGANMVKDVMDLFKDNIILDQHGCSVSDNDCESHLNTERIRTLIKQQVDLFPKSINFDYRQTFGDEIYSRFK